MQTIKRDEITFTRQQFYKKIWSVSVASRRSSVPPMRTLLFLRIALTNRRLASCYFVIYRSLNRFLKLTSGRAVTH